MSYTLMAYSAVSNTISRGRQASGGFMKDIKLQLATYMEGEHVYATLVGYPEGRVDIGRFGRWDEARNAAVRYFEQRRLNEINQAFYDGVDPPESTRLVEHGMVLVVGR